jgi:hypothetical protein
MFIYDNNCAAVVIAIASSACTIVDKSPDAVVAAFSASFSIPTL